MNQLLAQLGIARMDTAAADAVGWAAGDDAPGRCPVFAAEALSIDRAALDERAQRIVPRKP